MSIDRGSYFSSVHHFTSPSRNKPSNSRVDTTFLVAIQQTDLLLCELKLPAISKQWPRLLIALL